MSLVVNKRISTSYEQAQATSPIGTIRRVLLLLLLKNVELYEFRNQRVPPISKRLKGVQGEERNSPAPFWLSFGTKENISLSQVSCLQLAEVTPFSCRRNTPHQSLSVTDTIWLNRRSGSPTNPPSGFA